jgi:hypothetical protein
MVLFGAFSVGVASASVTFHQDQALHYDNGTYVMLPAGTYGNVTKTANVWYVDGEVYPTPTPTAAPAQNGVSSGSVEMGVLLGVGGAIVCILFLSLYLKGGNKQQEAPK